MKLKNVIQVLVIFVLCFSIAHTQTVKTVSNSRAYIISQKDTLGLDDAIGYSSVASITYSPRDSNAVKIYIDTAPKGTALKAATGWTVSDSLSYTTTSNTGADKEWLLRTSTINLITVVKGCVRLRVTQNGSGQGVTSARYSIVQQYIY